MASGAFGSPVGFNTIATTTVPTQQRSLGERLVRVVRGRLFEEDDRPHVSGEATTISGVVELLGDDGCVVGIGVVDTNITCGIELHQVNLCPFEVAVCVTRALDETKWIGEVVEKLLGDFMKKSYDGVVL